MTNTKAQQINNINAKTQPTTLQKQKIKAQTKQLKQTKN